MTEAEKVAAVHYVAMLEANERMDGDLARAKNKSGIVSKYMHTIPNRSKPDWQGDPFDFESKSSFESLYYSAAIGIGMHMYDRLLQVTG